ncbi:helicase-related protein [Athalassotoga saccharophila]|uniref:helicase-related protein n=1 Tax=Athalassotoga saccharophila TaxID=1441386 RepID=UPI001379A982|nr:helicase-related protein [Athalassotoga saccharophila]BBJ28540.1 ATP-dependent RNA helicase DbpA [Athalassotoga saccharophila]
MDKNKFYKENSTSFNKNFYESSIVQENKKSNLDLSFITNESGKTLKDRFNQLIRDCEFFDCLVAYFYISGFHSIYKSLEQTKNIRILIGINTNKETYNLIRFAEDKSQDSFQFSYLETRQIVENLVENEMSESEDNQIVEEGVQKFIEWIKNGKLQVKAYPFHDIHAKLYIMTFREGDRDKGRVITGSSNFTQSGLADNIEFNVELKNYADYEFAKQKFEELWKESVDVSEKFVQTINSKTWLNQDITPYELYLKFLYEYFKEELTRNDDVFMEYLPQNFKRFKYQEQAVLNAKRILEEYGGVFISDVVGLGKTYITAMLANQIDGRTLVIAPPAILNKSNPGSWPNVFSDFHVPAEYVSIGNLNEAKKIVERTDFKNIIIDEAHRFRNEITISYEKISEICRGKRVILVSATPYNNSPKDILALIKLFQNARKSTIPGVQNLETFFSRLESKLNLVDRQKDYNDLIEIEKSNSKEIRDKILKYLMVRRTRAEIEKYFSEDLKKNKIKFPEVKAPKPFYYQLNDEEDKIFMETVRLITKKFKYARYTPLLYLMKNISHIEEQSQRNMGSFMKVLLVKRLESSFYAFRNSIDRFINSYKKFIEEYDKGNVYVSKGYINKIFELLELGNDEAVQKLIDEGKAERYPSKDFKSQLKDDLENDLKILENIKSIWQSINRDPKIETLLDNLNKDNIFKDNKIIIFTESKETAEYLTQNINNHLGKIALLFHGDSKEEVRDQVIENFDARAKNKKDDYRILVSTEVLSEGVNLHRSNVIINYDIPWNPTRLMQRIGRINRIDTSFDKIYTFNFFPTKQSDSEIELTRIASSKINEFLTLLGGDAFILTEGEPVSSHELFDKLISKEIVTEGETEESELKYLKVIENIRENDPHLFEKIKQLPRKARCAKMSPSSLSNITLGDFLITFFRKGRLIKFFLSDRNSTIEIDFLRVAEIIESSLNTKKEKLPLHNYYEFLERNKNAFLVSTQENFIENSRHIRNDSATNILKILKAIQQDTKRLTEEQEEYISKLISRIEEGSLPKQTMKKATAELNKLGSEKQNPLKVINTLQRVISKVFLESHYVETSSIPEGKRETILSLYLINGGGKE